jgi:2-succinyl-5-enolpyruvyl-6-hydroxy-3-cyclohexene-1-carboxylate synthase
MAHELNSPVTAFLGDLSALHDLNALNMLRDRKVILVIVNNDGGGIFSFLPIARHPQVFEQDFGTPHGLAFRQAAGMFSLPHASPATPDEFRAVYAEALDRDGSTIIELVTSRGQLVADHERVFSHLRTTARG